MSEDKVQKPFLKWVGGKTQILKKIISKIPVQMDNYHELFLGGGSVLLAVLSLQKLNKITIHNKIYAYDYNKGLINTFNQIKMNINEVIKELNILKNQFINIKKNIEIEKSDNTEQDKDTKQPKKTKKTKPKDINENTYKNTREHYYYWIRDLYNKETKDNALSCAYFIFLNKTGYRGMYREGKNGYNIPYGLKDKKTIPSIFSEEELVLVSELIKDVEFKEMHFKDSIKLVSEGDFVYLDPPYVPIDANSFVEYNSDSFNLKTHELLFNEIKKLKDIKFIMSNAKVDLVTDNFKEYNCVDIIARRAIHSKKPQTTATEVIIYNY